MTREEVTKFFDQCKKQGMNSFQILEVLQRMYNDGKIPYEALLAMAEMLGFELGESEKDNDFDILYVHEVSEKENLYYFLHNGEYYGFRIRNDEVIQEYCFGQYKDNDKFLLFIMKKYPKYHMRSATKEDSEYVNRVY